MITYHRLRCTQTQRVSRGEPTGIAQAIELGRDTTSRCDDQRPIGIGYEFTYRGSVLRLFRWNASVICLTQK